MPQDPQADSSRFKVVVNDEDQYSIWPHAKTLPSGWREVAKIGSKEECLAYIKEVWTDMRPRSLRARMDAVSHGSESGAAV